MVRRLSEPSVATRALAPEPPPERVRRAASAASPDVGSGGRCAIVLWREVPGGAALETALARQLRSAVASVHAAGGRDDAETAWADAVDGAEPVVIVAEGFEAPDKAAFRLLRALRTALGPRRHLVVVVVDASAGALRGADDAQVRIWRDGVARLEDPYVAVEPLREPP